MSNYDKDKNAQEQKSRGNQSQDKARHEGAKTGVDANKDKNRQVPGSKNPQGGSNRP